MKGSIIHSYVRTYADLKFRGIRYWFVYNWIEFWETTFFSLDVRQHGGTPQI